MKKCGKLILSDESKYIFFFHHHCNHYDTILDKEKSVICGKYEKECSNQRGEDWPLSGPHLHMHNPVFRHTLIISTTLFCILNNSPLPSITPNM